MNICELLTDIKVLLMSGITTTTVIDGNVSVDKSDFVPHFTKLTGGAVWTLPADDIQSVTMIIVEVDAANTVDVVTVDGTTNVEHTISVTWTAEDELEQPLTITANGTSCVYVSWTEDD